jgi:hypothetical protein
MRRPHRSTQLSQIRDKKFCLTQTTLDTGEVLVAGGQNSNLMYHPATGTFRPTDSLNNARSFHTASLLNNGQVLIAAGTGALNSAELDDPTSGRSGVTGSLNIRRTDRSAVLLHN